MDSLLLSLWLHFPDCRADMERERDRECDVGETLRRVGNCVKGCLHALEDRLLSRGSLEEMSVSNLIRIPENIPVAISALVSC